MLPPLETAHGLRDGGPSDYRRASDCAAECCNQIRGPRHARDGAHGHVETGACSTRKIWCLETGILSGAAPRRYQLKYEFGSTSCNCHLGGQQSVTFDWKLTQASRGDGTSAISSGICCCAMELRQSEISRGRLLDLTAHWIQPVTTRICPSRVSAR